MTPNEALEQVRAVCLSFPATSERLSHNAPTFFIRDKTSFVMFHDDHHGDGRLALWCAAPAGAQELLIDADPEQFFRPAYVGHRGWIGVRIDVDRPWAIVEDIIEDAFRRVAPATLLRQLDQAPPT